MGWEPAAHLLKAGAAAAFCFVKAGTTTAVTQCECLELPRWVLQYQMQGMGTWAATACGTPDAGGAQNGQWTRLSTHSPQLSGQRVRSLQKTHTGQCKHLLPMARVLRAVQLPAQDEMTEKEGRSREKGEEDE